VSRAVADIARAERRRVGRGSRRGLGIDTRFRPPRRLIAAIWISGLYCMVVQWPLWARGEHALVAGDLLVAVSFAAAAVFVGARREHRATAVALSMVAVLWPLNWVNAWNSGIWPLTAALIGPAGGLCAVWALLRYPLRWPSDRVDHLVLGSLLATQVLATLQVVTSLPQSPRVSVSPATKWALRPRVTVPPRCTTSSASVDRRPRCCGGSRAG